MPKGWRKCKCCGVSFEKKRPLQSVCSALCAYEYAKNSKKRKINENGPAERKN